MVRIILIRSQIVFVGVQRWVRLSSASLHAWIPSECGMLMYNELTSRVTRMEFLSRLLRLREFNLFGKWFVSLM